MAFFKKGVLAALMILTALSAGAQALDFRARTSHCIRNIECGIILDVLECDGEDVTFTAYVGGSAFDSIYLPECNKGSFRLTYDSSDWSANPIGYGSHSVKVSAQENGVETISKGAIFEIRPPTVRPNMDSKIIVGEKVTVNLEFNDVYDEIRLKTKLDDEKIGDETCQNMMDCVKRLSEITYDGEETRELETGIHEVVAQVYEGDEKVSETVAKFEVVDKIPYERLYVSLPQKLDAWADLSVKLTLEGMGYDAENNLIQVSVKAYTPALGEREIYSGKRTVNAKKGGDYTLQIGSDDFEGESYGRYARSCSEVALTFTIGGDFEAGTVEKDTLFTGRRIELTHQPDPPVKDTQLSVRAYDGVTSEPIEFFKAAVYDGERLIDSKVLEKDGLNTLNLVEYAKTADYVDVVFSSKGYCNKVLNLNLRQLPASSAPANPSCSSNADCTPKVTQAPFCRGNTMMQDITWGECVSPGTKDSKCVAKIEQSYVKDCGQERICSEGTCMDKKINPATASNNEYQTTQTTLSPPKSGWGISEADIFGISRPTDNEVAGVLWKIYGAVVIIVVGVFFTITATYGLTSGKNGNLEAPGVNNFVDEISNKVYECLENLKRHVTGGRRRAHPTLDDIMSQKF